jgi:integrase
MALGTDLAIKNWKPRGRQAMPCGGRDGLYVRSDTAGRKAFYWRKGSFYKLGNYPALSLSQARAMVAVCNEQARQGIEAAAIVASLRQSSSITDAAEKDTVTIRSAPRSLLRSRKKGTIESYEDAFEAYYEAYAASNLQVGPSRNAPLQWHRNVPVSLKAMPIRDITRSDIFPWMLKLLQTKHETGRKLRGLMDRVFEFAINLGVVNSNPVPPRRAFEVKRPKTRHHATIRPKELPKMWQHISQSGAGGAMKLLLKLAILSGHRVDVNRLARWDHIDLYSRQWTVPERVDKETEGLMKSGRSHVVTLPQDFLDQMISGRSDDTYVFVNSNDDPFSENAMLKVVKGYDGECTIHGFRNARKIWGKDIAGFDDWVMDFYEDHEESKGVLDDEYRRRPEETKIARCADVTEALYEFCKNG